MERNYRSLSTKFHLVAFLLLPILKLGSMYEPGCSRPLGLMTGEIEDWQLSASSLRSAEGCEVKWGRVGGSIGRGWCAEGEGNQWLLVDLGVSAAVTGILIQGRETEWVTAFALSHSEDAFKWTFLYDVYGKKRMFEGNVDGNSIRTIWLESPVETRFIRIHVLSWNKFPSLRLEVLGCQECASVVSGPGVGSGLIASSLGFWSKKNPCHPSDGHIHSSKAWCSRLNNGNQWLQLDLSGPTLVSGVVSKGRGDGGKRQWVTSYSISYSNDSYLWFYYKEVNHLSPKTFGGNMDKNTERRHYLNSPFTATFVRIHPKSWHNHIALRAALLGCPTKECPPNYFRLNPLGPCTENLAWRKEVWSNDKRHFWKDWKYGHASLAVDGSTDLLLPRCAILDNYYADSPVWMVDLGRKTQISGLILLTWQGEGQDKTTSYRDYVFNLEKFTVYVSVSARLEASLLEGEPSCGSITRENNALFRPRLNFDCGGVKGRYVYIVATPVSNRWDRIFNSVFCEVFVYSVS